MDIKLEETFNVSEVGLLCYHHFVGSRFMMERHQIAKALGKTTPEEDKAVIQTQEIVLNINEKFKKFMEATKSEEAIFDALDTLFLKEVALKDIIRSMQENNNSANDFLSR